MSIIPINKTWEQQQAKLVKATHKLGVVNGINIAARTLNVAFTENPQTIVKNIPVASGINMKNITVGMQCRVDLFNETNSGNMVVAYIIGQTNTVGQINNLGTVGAASTIDVTIANLITLKSTASTNMTLTPSGVGYIGQIIIIQITSDSSGGDIVTFASTFHSTGTMTLTASKVHTITFECDGNAWYETSRALAL